MTRVPRPGLGRGAAAVTRERLSKADVERMRSADGSGSAAAGRSCVR